MRIEQTRWTESGGWEPPLPLGPAFEPTLVLLFGSRSLLGKAGPVDDIRRRFSTAHFLGCSTAGEICGTQVTDNTLVATAIRFEHTRIAGARVKIDTPGDSYGGGVRLARALDFEGLAHVFVLSDGLHVNGSDLVRGLTATLPEGVTVTGGLSGDGQDFRETLVLWDDEIASDSIAIVGFYGDRVRVGYASLGGWDPFGPERVVTRSSGNVLHELDGRSALSLYKEYLGEHAHGLPATGLLFPLCIRTQTGERGVVRTILAVNEADETMTFAGDVPQGSLARLMKANFDRLVDGAVGAARISVQASRGSMPELGILISCVGRKLILKQRIEEEVEGVRDVLGERAVLTGFYSYGEISPFTPNAKCELHNQTMTITTLHER